MKTLIYAPICNELGVLKSFQKKHA